MADKALESITIKAARSMVRAHKDKYHGTEGYTRSVWYPIDKMATLMRTIADEGADGVKFYFGQYTDEAILDYNNVPGRREEDKIPKDHNGRNTLIIVSTREENGVPNCDYTVVPFFTDPENRGALCPPDVCDCNSFIIDPLDPNPACK